MKLEVFFMAHKKKMQELDYMAWLSNQYTMSAVSVAVEHNLAGNKAKSKYIEKPFLQSIESESNNGNKESKEEVAIYEMKQRINYLRKQGLPESPA